MASTVRDANYLKAAAGVSARGRKLQKPVKHIVISWPAGAEPSENEQLDATSALLTELGLKDRQRVTVAHHICVNRVSHVDGRAAPARDERLTASTWAERFERERRPAHRVPGPGREPPAPRGPGARGERRSAPRRSAGGATPASSSIRCRARPSYGRPTTRFGRTSPRTTPRRDGPGASWPATSMTRTPPRTRPGTPPGSGGADHRPRLRRPRRRRRRTRETTPTPEGCRRVARRRLGERTRTPPYADPIAPDRGGGDADAPGGATRRPEPQPPKRRRTGER